MTKEDAWFLELDQIFINYLEQLEALESYVESIEQLLLERQKNRLKTNKRLEYVSQLLSASILTNLIQSEKVNEEIAVTDEMKKVKNETIEKILKNNEILEDLKSIRIIDIKDGIRFEILDNERKKDFEEYFDSIEEVRNHTDLLYRSSLITLVVTFELLITNIIQYRAKKYPSSINIDEKQLSFKDIEKLGSLEEAKNYLIEEHVTDLMRQSNEHWIQYIKKNTKIKLEKEIEDYEDIINETYNRRNLIVHGGGIVNNIYITKVSEELRKGLKKGDLINIDKEYILDRINTFKVYGLALMYAFWMKMDKENEDRAKIAQAYAFKLLKKEEYFLARKIYKVILSDRLSQSLEFMIKINYWQTFKWTGELELVKKDIEEIDLSASRLDFQMCKDLLLDKNYEAFEKLKRLVSTGEYSIDHLLEWPILKNLYQMQEFNDYLKENGYLIEELQS
jgi:hypothetical protein